jgi:small-conductance mechanosensitive channel
MQTKVPAELSTHEHEQSRFLGRLLVVPLLSLPMFAVWVMISSVLTPASMYASESTHLALRWAMIGFGAVLIAICDGVAVYILLRSQRAWLRDEQSSVIP